MSIAKSTVGLRGGLFDLVGTTPLCAGDSIAVLAIVGERFGRDVKG